MSVRIPYTQATSKDEAFNKIKGQVTAEYLAQFKISAEVKYDDLKKCIKAKGQGFELEMQFDDSACCFDLNLSFLLRPFKNKILDKIEGQIKNNI